MCLIVTAQNLSRKMSKITLVTYRGLEEKGGVFHSSFCIFHVESCESITQSKSKTSKLTTPPECENRWLSPSLGTCSDLEGGYGKNWQGNM